MTRAADFRLINHACAEHRSRWWDGSQARLTVPTFLQENPASNRAAARRNATQRP